MLRPMLKNLIRCMERTALRKFFNIPKRIKGLILALCLGICVFTMISSEITLYARDVYYDDEDTGDDTDLGVNADTWSDKDHDGTEDTWDQSGYGPLHGYRGVYPAGGSNDSVDGEDIIADVAATIPSWGVDVISAIIFGIGYAIDSCLSGAFETNAGVAGNIDLSLDAIIFGRVYKGIDYINWVSFELYEGNPYGIVGSYIYIILRGVMYALLPFLVLYMLLKVAISDDVKARGQLKETLIGVVIFYVIVYLMPQLFDLAQYFRDSVLNLIGNKTGILGGGGIIDGFRNLYDGSLLTSVLYVAACIVSISYLKSYIGIALQQTALFSLFPFVALMGIRDKKLYGRWVSEFFMNLLIPIIDGVLFFIEISLGSMAYCTIKGETVGDRMFDRAFLSALTGVPIGISLILLIMLGSLIPARNAILRLLGNVGVLPVRGGAGSIVAAAAMAMRAMNRGGNGGAGAPATTQAEKSIEALEKADASLQESFNESMRNANMLDELSQNATSDLNDSGLLDIKGEDIDEQLSSGGTGSMGGGASDEEISTGSADDLSSVETGGSDPNSEIDSAMDNTLPDNPDVPDVETDVNGGSDSGEMPSPNSMDDVAIDNGGAVDTNVVGDTSEAIPSGNMVSSEDMAGLGIEHGAVASSDPYEQFTQARGENLANMDKNLAEAEAIGEESRTFTNALMDFNGEGDTFSQQHADTLGKLSDKTKSDLIASREAIQNYDFGGEGVDVATKNELRNNFSEKLKSGNFNDMTEGERTLANNYVNALSKAQAELQDRQSAYSNAAKECLSKEQRFANYASTHEGFSQGQINKGKAFESSEDYNKMVRKENIIKRYANLKSFDSDQTKGVLSSSEKASLYRQRAANISSQREVLAYEKQRLEDNIKANQKINKVRTVAGVGTALIGAGLGMSASAADGGSLVGGAVSGGMAGGMVGSKAIKDKQYVPDQGATLRMSNLKADYKNNATTKPTNMATGGNTVSYDRNTHGNAYYKNYDDEGNRIKTPAESKPSDSKPKPRKPDRRGEQAKEVLDEAGDGHNREYNDFLRKNEHKIGSITNFM